MDAAKVCGREETRFVANHFNDCGSVGGDHGRAASHRLQRRQSRAFIKSRINHDSASGVERAQFRVAEISGETQAMAQFCGIYVGKQLIREPAFLPRDHELRAQRR